MSTEWPVIEWTIREVECGLAVDGWTSIKSRPRALRVIIHTMDIEPGDTMESCIKRSQEIIKNILSVEANS